MKKCILVLSVVACLLAPFLFCVEAEAAAQPSQDQMEAFAEELVGEILQIVRTGSIEMYASDPVVYEGMKSFQAALEEMGGYQSILNHNVEYNDGITIELELKGFQRNGIFRLVMDQEGMWTEMSTHVVYGFGETMAKAGLNTLMGMGTVFAVLILIIFIISAFSLIGKAQEKKPKKMAAVPKTEDRVEEESAAEEAEELSDDSELIAVIAAAIAAYESAVGSKTVSADNYVVRSIKRRYR